MRWSRRLPLGYLVAAAVLPLILAGLLLTRWMTATMPGASASMTRAQIGDAAPEIDVRDLDGRPMRLADLRGHPVIVTFWASWCTDCVSEMPLLRDAEARHAADGLRVLGIAIQDRADAATAFAVRQGMTWPSALDADGAISRAYGIYAPPDSFFIDADGRIAGRQIGQLSRADLDRQLATIIGTNRGTS